MISMNAQTYTWDANGNLIDDGNGIYTYNYFNQLKTLASSGNTYTYDGYDGLGNRVSQGDNGVAHTYVLDISRGLSQVLSDNDQHYLYGYGRIAEQDTNWEYFHTDGLGSVRQITNQLGEVVLNQGFDSYGNAKAVVGTAGSNYGYAGQVY
jgi:hypothetical protein